MIMMTTMMTMMRSIMIKLTLQTNFGVRSLCTYVHVYIYIYMYGCLYVYMCICIQLCIYVYVALCIYVYTCNSATNHSRSALAPVTAARSHFQRHQLEACCACARLSCFLQLMLNSLQLSWSRRRAVTKEAAADAPEAAKISKV